MRSARGFSVLELMVVGAIVTAMAGLAGFSLVRVNRALRLDGAAREMLQDLRFAQSIALRTNRAVTFNLRTGPVPGGAERCASPSYEVAGREADAPVRVSYRRVCFDPDVATIVMNPEGAAGFGPLACINEAIGAPQPVLAAGCSFCDGNAGFLRFLPTGEVQAGPNPAPGGVESLALTWRDRPDVPGDSARVRVVRIATNSGRIQMLRPTATVAGGAFDGWECR